MSEERLRDIERRLAAVVEAVNGLAGIAADVTALSERLAHGAPAVGAPRRPSWFEVDAEQAVAMLDELSGWVGRVLVRHEAAREALPECWMLHGEVVENLVWLMDTWTLAYRDPASTAVQVADWHERRLPGLMQRIKRYPGRSCSFAEHEDGGGGTAYRLREEHRPHERLAVGDPAAVAEYARWWAATRGLGAGPPPLR